MRTTCLVAAALAVLGASSAHAQRRARIGPTYSSITLEDRSVASASVAFGGVRKGEFLDGTVGPAASFLIPISGSLHGRAPFVGARFRRDTKKAGTVAVQIDLAPLRITGACPATGCNESAVLFAPGYEASVRPVWGRVYGQFGLLLAGVYSQGPDRGIAQGAHGGLGVDLYGGRSRRASSPSRSGCPTITWSRFSCACGVPVWWIRSVAPRAATTSPVSPRSSPSKT